MKRFYIVFLLLFLCLGTFSQEITVRFTGRLNGTNYCQLDSVAVINLSRNWTEMIEYPDTIIVLGGTGDAELNVASAQGLGQNVPNPFDCETRVELSLSQREDVRLQLLDASGRLCADYSSTLDAGVHTFDISAASPQTYILNASVGNRNYSIRMVNVGNGCGSSIKYSGISGGITAKLTTTNKFLLGDNMRYVGYATIAGDVVASAAVEHAQALSEDITLNFSHCQPLAGQVEVSACGSYEWNNETYTESGDYQQVFTAANGCDSVVTLHLTISHSNTGIDEQTACGSYTWIDGVTYTESTNEPTFTLTNATGCDSVVTLHLTINHSNTGIDEQTACDSYTWIDGVTYTESTNEPTFTLVNAAGCDSVVTLHLTIVCPPTVQTNVATGVTTTGVTLNGNVTSDGGATVTARGFLYGTDENNLTEDVQSGSGTGDFTANLTDLTSGTTYYYKAYATNNAGTAYGEVMSFTTPNHPTVTTGTASSVTSTGATLSGNVTSDGGATVTTRGFLYGTNSSNLSQTVQSGSGTGSFTANLTDLTSGTTYYYKAYATNSAGSSYGEVRSFTTENSGATTGTLNGHDWVDLGLPSGTRWATCNIGAENPEDYGNYYAWGEITTKTTYNWSTYRYCNGSSITLTKYCNNSNYGNNGFTDNLTILEASDDAANANWGAGWRMPTYDELNELQSNCTVTWTTQNGVNGRLFTGPNGNSIFLPAAGYRNVSELLDAGSDGDYWSSSLYWGYAGAAWFLFFNSDSCGMIGSDRYYGLSVRPVCASQ